LYYDYNEYLMTKIMQLFSLDDVRSIIAEFLTCLQTFIDSSRTYQYVNENEFL